MKKSIVWMLAAILFCSLTTVFSSCKSSSEEMPSSWSYGVGADITLSHIGATPGSALEVYANSIENRIKQTVSEKRKSWEVWCNTEQAPAIATVENAKAIIWVNELANALKNIKTEVDNKDKSELTGTGSFDFEIKVYGYNNLPAGDSGYFKTEIVTITFTKE